MTGRWLIFTPFGYFKGKPAEGSEANAPEKSHVHHHLRFLRGLIGYWPPNGKWRIAEVDRRRRTRRFCLRWGKPGATRKTG
jgi:hypothetical protein